MTEDQALEAAANFWHACEKKFREAGGAPREGENVPQMSCKELLAGAGRTVQRDALLIQAAEVIDDLVLVLSRPHG